MRKIALSDIDLMQVGHEIQLYGAIYSDSKRLYLIPMPDEDSSELDELQVVISTTTIDSGKRVKEPLALVMDSGELEAFFKQTDLLDVVGPDKVILRKSQRQIDQVISWRVFRRDGYACRYCGREDVPLTVDHVDLWEDGGVSVDANLITACRRCNKLRGRTPYDSWIASVEYKAVSQGVDSSIIRKNALKVRDLPDLWALRGKRRSR